MNATVNKSLKVLTCAAAAVLITTAMSAGFVESTTMARASSTYVPSQMVKFAIRAAGHAWFGHPEPAVLVD